MDQQKAFHFLDALRLSFEQLDLPFRILMVAVPSELSDPEIDELTSLVQCWYKDHDYANDQRLHDTKPQ